MRTEAEKKARRTYRANTKRMTIDFYKTDADLVEHIEKQPEKQKYIKDLIRADIKKGETI